ncbi:MULTISPECIES: hypothetical protein [Corynebacterium]|uniref:hypothetical protein n=1 Tax=Corynebacterium TaxID=1716 RepID=UPI001EF3E823|nr:MULTISPECIES: hypothetical protein [Corynebacterium]MCG7236708.1 hypothetical protein [Corynebacterium sp. ACRQP]
MNKRVLAPAMAIAIAAGSVIAVGNADAKEMTAAELYEPTIGGAYDLGPDEYTAYLTRSEGPRLASVDLNLFESPYPGLKAELDNSPYAYPGAIKLRLEGGKIYPERFDVLTGVTVHYDDGSSEYVEGSFTVRPLKALVAGEPAEPVEPTTTPRATVSVTETTTATETETYTETVTQTTTEPEPYPVYETETVTATTTETATQTETTTSTEYYPEPYPEIFFETETVTATTTETATQTETTTSTEYYPEPYPEVSYETETVTVTATTTVAPPVVTTSAAQPVPTRSSDDELTLADIYDPEISTLGGYDIGPSESYAYLVSGEGPEMADVEVLQFDSPYPISYSLAPKNALINHRAWINVAVEPKKIYPAEFKVAVAVRVTYNDGSSEEVSGLLPIRPVKSLVTGNPVPSTTSKGSATTSPSTVTITREVEVPGKQVTVTATAEPLPPKTVTATLTERVEVPGEPVTVTATKEALAPKTVTATATAAPATVTATVTRVEKSTVEAPTVTVDRLSTVLATPAAKATTVTVTPAPNKVTATVTSTLKETSTETTVVKATETVTKAADRPADGSGSSLSTGGIIGVVVALLAALGVGAFALAGGLPPQIANALPF